MLHAMVCFMPTLPPITLIFVLGVYLGQNKCTYVGAANSIML